MRIMLTSRGQHIVHHAAVGTNLQNHAVSRNAPPGRPAYRADRQQVALWQLSLCLYLLHCRLLHSQLLMPL
jgi:hypothetical protein